MSDDNFYHFASCLGTRRINTLVYIGSDRRATGKQCKQFLAVLFTFLVEPINQSGLVVNT